MSLTLDRPIPDSDAAEARGFALFVGIDEEAARAAGTDLASVVDAFRRLAADLVPASETFAAVALAPRGSGGRDLDIVRRAVGRAAPSDDAPVRRTGVVIDLGRRTVTLDGHPAALTYREVELLAYLVLREGRTVSRAELIDGLWANEADAETPNERTIDVHVRRLRAKLSGYESILRTVRGAGYRFDRHADVRIRVGTAPSPDRF